MAAYQVHGPFEVPVQRLPGGRTLDLSEIKSSFWPDLEGLAKTRGCYIFGIRGRNVIPIYVGKATKSFRQECFSAHKLAHHYGPALLTRRGTPVLFLVSQKSQKGAPNLSEIGTIEKFLIQVAISKNPELSNVHHTKQAEWSVDGVIRARQGTNSTASGKFKKMMGL